MVRNNRYQPRYSNPNAALGGPEMGTTAGVGITAGVGTVVNTEITKLGKRITTHIFINVIGLHSATTLVDLIGVDSVGVCHLGIVDFAESGVVSSGSMTCLVVPVTGVTDIDLYAADEGTGVEDTNESALTATELVGAGGAWTLAETQVLAALPTDGQYLYLAVGVAGTVGVYTAGQFLIELIGYEA